MDWKEGLKWFGVIVAAGAVGTVMEIFLTNYINKQSSLAARTELQTLIAQAQQMASQRTSEPPPMLEASSQMMQMSYSTPTMAATQSTPPRQVTVGAPRGVTVPVQSSKNEGYTVWI